MSSLASRTGSIVGRLALLAVVVGGTGVLVGTLFLPTALTVTDVVDAVQRDVFDVPPLPSTDPLAENSFVYAADGTLIDELARDQSRIPVSLEEIPDVMVNAVIATEDANFWEHNGINPTAIARAALQNVAAGGIESGASTITQQYVKNAYIDAERRTEQSYNRKIQEALWAIDLEKQVSKQEILEGYLNRTYFGNGVYGVEKAAERYFSKELSDLQLHEAAMLAGLIRAPITNSPLSTGEDADPETGVKVACLDSYTGEERCNAKLRRDIVLNQMALHGFISQDQADRAKAQPLGLVVSPPTEEGQAKWWLDWVAKQLTSQDVARAVGIPNDLLETLGETEEERFDFLFQGGLRIHTTLDLNLQAEAERVIRDFLTYEDMPIEEIARSPFGGLVTVEPGTGAVKVAAVGPYEYGSCSPTDGGEFIGTDDAGRLLCDKTKLYPVVPGGGGSGRQPGSSLKPFTIAAALEVGLPPGWEVDATGPAKIDGCDEGGDWEVNNSGGNGIRDMYTGVKASSNVFHAKLIAEIGPTKTWEVLHRFGFEPDYQEKMDLAVERGLPGRFNLLRVKPECALALGAADVYPLEMAASYAGIANDGVYCKPYAITRIEDRDGKVLYEHTPDCEQAVDTEIARRVVDIMRGPVTSGGTAPFITGDLSPHPVRGKTGTTNDYIDAWFVGYTPQLATASWVGYPNGIVSFETLEQAQAACPQEFRDAPDRTSPFCFERRYMTGADSVIGGKRYGRVFGGTIPAPMWSSFMQIAMDGVEPGSFPNPGSLPGATVPDFSGLTTIAAMEELAEKANVNLLIQTVTDYRPKGAFVSQSPAAGSRVQAGNAVTVFLSDGKGEIPKVPNVVGETEADAIAILEEAGYEALKVTKETSDPEQVGRVLAQSPAGGEELKPEEGATVVIQVGIEAPPEPEPSPTPSPPGNGGGGGGGNKPPPSEPPPGDESADPPPDA